MIFTYGQREVSVCELFYPPYASKTKNNKRNQSNLPLYSSLISTINQTSIFRKVIIRFEINISLKSSLTELNLLHSLCEISDIYRRSYGCDNLFRKSNVVKEYEVRIS
ncbi:hypothetical protein RIR_jg41832.t1 [Rhizophagus irregularis DAOM 181602=DAOM 197198]|nr:hypothetical protein RIR_jg41832.t1 [Rhizophagus irregularis DAOM 181602=DAOM 197198]